MVWQQWVLVTLYLIGMASSIKAVLDGDEGGNLRLVFAALFIVLVVTI